MSGQLTAETLAAKIKDAYYAARDNGGTMHTAADDAAAAILALVPAHNEAIRSETLLAAADAYGPEGTDATDWLRDRAEAAS